MSEIGSKKKDISWRVAIAIVLGFFSLLAFAMEFESFSPRHLNDPSNFATRLTWGLVLIVCMAGTFYMLLLEARAIAANRPTDVRSIPTGQGMPPKVRKVIFIQVLVAIFCGFMSWGFYMGYLPEGKVDFSPGLDRAFMYALLYWSLASIGSSVLIWRRSRIGWALAWTVFPGILRTIPLLISLQMTDYLAGGV